jgi:zinc protease
VHYFFSNYNTSSEEKIPELTTDDTKIELDNGPDIIFHAEKSTPIITIELMVHVGSERKIKGRSGFAHLF